MTDTLIKLFKRDLTKLKSEIRLYEDEADLWIIEKDISNSAGNLCLHIIGNLNHFIGATLGKTGYVRQRNAEFNLKDIPVKELSKMIDDTVIVIRNVLEKLSNDDLIKIYPVKVFDEEMTTEFFLIHLVAHLNYHLGQINYHRRLLKK
ncbi:MAG: DinB family protein [Ignavibacteria bacterium]|jgi:uncharacterized damage-inducible protein DinB